MRDNIQKNCVESMQVSLKVLYVFYRINYLKNFNETYCRRRNVDIFGDISIHFLNTFTKNLYTVPNLLPNVLIFSLL